ncbi:DHA2 family efflux MFS transporter permease subunit [Sphaerisporangium sp. NPDC088356]|uniref:DHA2 family efflux MFS transporter permease subunit n=1 Tax=Sphaerisporangium sp. NPDC088356 TaxID=3154871 RepID=UPI003424D266
MTDRAAVRAEPGERAAPRKGLDPSLLRIAMILAFGAFVALLDTTIVGVAVHSFARDFSAELADVQWTSTAYLLAMGAVIPATGWASQRYGATAMWIASLCVFALGSALCGLAGSLGALIAFRVVQGLGAGMLFPLMRIILVEIAGRDSLGRLMALIAIPVQIAPIIGPIAGGAIIQDLSWRWAFFLNVPILVAVIALSAAFVPNSRGTAAGRLDVIGLVAISGTLSLFVYGFSVLSQGGSATKVGVLVPLVGGALLLVAYGLRSARSQAPGVVEFDLFRDRAFAASTAVTFLNNFTLFGAVFLVPLFFQQAGGAGALSAGLVLAPQGLGMLVAVLVVGRVIDLRNNYRRLVTIGLVLVTIGTVPFALAGSGSENLLLMVALLIRGVGLALAISPTMVTLYHSIPGNRVPAATTANAIVQQVAGAMGTAVVALLLQAFLASGDAVAAFRSVFWVAVAFVVLTFVPAMFLPTRKIQET